jgi:rhodanese-related sulfurtransferase
MRHLPFLFTLALVAAPAAGIAAAEKAGGPPAEAKAAATKAVSKADLERAIAAKKVVIIDVNGTASWQRGHIPGAIDFQARQADLASVLPAAKDALIVAYCGSSSCNAYRLGTAAAIRLGYTNVRHYTGGLAGWVAAGGSLEAGAAPAPAPAPAPAAR